MTTTITDRDEGMERIERAVRQLHGAVITVGVHGDAVRKDDDTRLNAVQIAAVHEYGSATVPERSFIRSTLDRDRGAILDHMTAASEHALRGGDPRRAVERVGIDVESRIRKTIRDGIDPALADSTIERRKAKTPSGGANDRNPGRIVPLIDTGQLIQSVTSKVDM